METLPGSGASWQAWRASLGPSGLPFLPTPLHPGSTTRLVHSLPMLLRSGAACSAARLPGFR